MENKEVLATLQIANSEVRFVLAEFHNGKLNILHVEKQKHQGVKMGRLLVNLLLVKQSNKF